MGGSKKKQPTTGPGIGKHSMKQISLKGATVFGVDISHHNGTVDYAKMKKEGVVFAYIKATQGNSFVSPSFLTHVKGCHENGILPGAYHFMEATDSPQSQFSHFMKAMNLVSDKLKLIPDVDWELQELPGVKENECAKGLVGLLEKEFKRFPLLYTGNWFAEKIKGMDAYFKQCPLWISDYSLPTANVPYPWDDFAIWQYTDKGTFASIPGKKYDFNWFNGNRTLFDSTLLLK